MLFLPIKFKTHIQLSPAELDSKYQERIYGKLRDTYEGLCTKYGYMKPNTIEIVKRSYGNFMKEHFNGYIRFELICRAEVCNPVQGNVVQAVIKNKNQLGILAECSTELDGKKVPILDIIIPIKSAGIISQVNLDSLQLGDSIMVEVLGKKYQMKDKKISIIGRVISRDLPEEPEEPIEEQEVEDDLEEEYYEEQSGGEMEENEEEDGEDGDKKRVLKVEEPEDDDEEEEDSDNEYDNEDDEDYEDDLDEEFDEGVPEPENP